MNDIDDTLVSDIYYKLSDAWDEKISPDNNNILARIQKNIKLYGNISVDEIDNSHSWIKVESPKITNMKFINTKGYQKHLKKCDEIEAYNKSIIENGNKEYFEYLKNIQQKNSPLIHRPLINYSFPLTKERPTPWNNYLMLKAYRCLLTKSIGFTYYIKNTFMIKPFHIIKHNWEFKTVAHRDFEYICNNCGIDGIKYRDMPSGEIFPKQDFMLSCNEHLIKKMLE